MHILQPKHIKLNEKESDELLSKLNVSKAQLPKILSTDPMLPEGCAIGDITLDAPRIDPLALQLGHSRVEGVRFDIPQHHTHVGAAKGGRQAEANPACCPGYKRNLALKFPHRTGPRTTPIKLAMRPILTQEVHHHPPTWS